MMQVVAAVGDLHFAKSRKLDPRFGMGFVTSPPVFAARLIGSAGSIHRVWRTDPRSTRPAPRRAGTGTD
jgi:hypothetical protein